MSDTPEVIPSGIGERFDFGGFGVCWKIDGMQTGARFSIIHHSLAPRTLAAPLHRHHREDEYSFVLHGTLGALLGDTVLIAKPGSWVVKPRGEWHTFWNAGASPCKLIEVISPAGFENYFREFSSYWPDRDRSAELRKKFELDMDVESVAVLCARFNLRTP